MKLFAVSTAALLLAGGAAAASHPCEADASPAPCLELSDPY